MESECEEDTTFCEPEVRMVNDDDNDVLDTEIRFVSVPGDVVQVQPTVLHEIDMKASWSRQMTKALIDEYTVMLALFRNPDKKQKDLWLHLANKLQERGYHVTWQMCDRKFRNLKQTYRTIYYSDRSEKSKRRWEFYDDLSSLVTPYSRFNTNTTKPTLLTKNMYTVDDRNCAGTTSRNRHYNDDDVLFSQGDEEGREEENITNPTTTNMPIWFTQFVSQYRNDQQRVLRHIRTMHSEIKQIELKKIELLQDLKSLLKSRAQ